MRTLNAGQTTILTRAFRSVYHRVKIKDAGGTARDYSTLRGYNWQRSVEWSEGNDEYLARAHIELGREEYSQSLAPLVSASVFNQSPGKYIDIGREITIETATVPLGQQPQSSDWVMVFHGYITSVDWAEPRLVIEAYDLAQRLQDTWIEVQRDYGIWAPGRAVRVGTVVVPTVSANAAPPVNYWRCTTAGTTNGGAWQPTTSYAQFSVVQTTTPDAPGYQRFFIKVAAGTGTSGSTEPNWPAYGSGGSVTDGTVTWFEYFGSQGTPTPEPAWPTSPANGTTQSDGTVVWTYNTVQTWTGNHTYSVGDMVNPITSGQTTQVWVCTASTSNTGLSDPFTGRPSPSLADQVNDGGVTWRFLPAVGGTLAETIIQSIFDDNSAGVTLTTTTPTGWYLKSFKQDRASLWQSVTRLAIQIGWDLRYWWSDSAGDFVPTLQPINRTGPAVAWTFSKARYFAIKKCARSIDSVRNAVRVVFSDRSTNTVATTDPAQASQPIRSEYIATDPTSIAAYGRRAMEIAESSASQISDPTSARALASAVLADLKEPTLALEVSMPYFWPVQLFDYLTFSANALHFDTDQTLSVVSITHRISGKEASTTLGLANTYPSQGPVKQGGMASLGNAMGNNLSNPTPPAGVAVAQTIGGAIVTFTPPTDSRHHWRHSELHISTSANFIPSSSTLKATSRTGRFEVTGLAMGTTHYARVVHRDDKGNASTPTTPQSFTPGTAVLSHLDTSIRRNTYAIVTADYTNNSTIKYQTNFNNGYGQVGYDPTSQWNNGSWTWTPAAAKYGIRATLEVDGLKPGDTVQILVYRVDLNAYVDASQVFAVVSDGSAQDRVSALLVTTMTFSAADVTAGAQVQFVMKAVTSVVAASRTIKSPQGLVISSANPYWAGSKLEITQQLA